MSPFDFVNSINDKKYILNEDNENDFNSYMVNKAFSLFPDTILLVNEANRLGLTGKMHYDFLFHVLSKRKRFAKWPKEENNDDIEFIMNHFEVTSVKAKEYLSILSDIELEELKDSYLKGIKQ
jgi:hypothetical protein